MQPDASQTPTFGLDDSVFMQVIEQGDIPQRIALAVQLAAFLCNEDAPQLERDQVIPAVLKLMADEEAVVRRRPCGRRHGLSRPPCRCALRHRGG